MAPDAPPPGRQGGQADRNQDEEEAAHGQRLYQRPPSAVNASKEGVRSGSSRRPSRARSRWREAADRRGRSRRNHPSRDRRRSGSSGSRRGYRCSATEADRCRRRVGAEVLGVDVEDFAEDGHVEIGGNPDDADAGRRVGLHGAGGEAHHQVPHDRRRVRIHADERDVVERPEAGLADVELHTDQAAECYGCAVICLADVLRE